MIPKYPIYIVSKGRYDTRYTAKSLEEMKCPYNIIVDATEVDEYTKATDERYGNVIIQPQKYYDDYDMFWEDTNKVTGPGAARNFAWDHSIEKGFDFHWVMDDNIQGFARLNRNKKYKVTSASIFRAMEDFVDRYENIAMAGPNYRFFASQNSKLPPFSMNTRIYSCNLIRNDTPYRWRGRYNEDTDLSLRMLKDNWCTVQFYAFLQNKVGTQQVKGGNTEQFYSKEGTYLKSKMLLDMHPDLTKLVYKFGRPHHFVDYTPFRKNKLKRKDNITVSKGINEYGMRLNSCPK
jgi:hypothetical protein|tara:strand:- start:84 stop:956 length:873 start_codon:yes stop_codon:yes gene_type:complete